MRSPAALLVPRAARRPRLLFLHPKSLTDSWPYPVDTLGEVVKAPSAVYPILASLLSDLPIETEIFDGYVSRETFSNYKRRLARADLLAISVMSPLKALDTELTIRLARALNPDLTIILGGNHATAYPQRWIEQCGADFVVTGEGETAFRSLMETLVAGGSDYSHIPNLTYRDGHVARRSLDRAPLIDLDNAPMPVWENVDLRPYRLGTVRAGLCATIEMSRGCPHRCDFCNINTFWNYKQRYKSVERVVDELERLHRLGVREFIFADDNFAQDYRRTTALFEAMIRRDFGFGFGCFVRGDTVIRNKEFAALAARAGMRFGLMGIETLEHEWLKGHHKGVRTHDVRQMYAEVYQTLKRVGIFLVGLFITPPEAEKSYRSGTGANGVVCDFHYTGDLVAQKGSALYDNLQHTNAVAKDMFYHDWNLSSIVLEDGRLQVSRKTLQHYARGLSLFGLKSLVSRDSFTRRFWWRHLGIVAERVLCTNLDDIRRFRVSKDESLTLEERQKYIADSIIGDAFISRLQGRRFWRSPLTLRNGLWSAAPISSD